MSSLKDKLSGKGNGKSSGKVFVHYSPVGTFSFPKLNTPDVPKDKNGNVKTSWKSTYQVAVEFDKSAENIEFFENMRVKDSEGNLVHILEFDGKSFVKDEGDKFVLRVRRNAERGQPRFFVPAGEKKSEEIEAPNALIWSGTKGSVSFTTYAYDGGVGAGLCGVTIHELVGPPEQKEDKVEEVVAPKKKTSNKDIFGK